MNELTDVSVTKTVKVGEEDQMYGSVTTVDIQKLLAEQGVTVDKKEIVLTEPIRTLGVYNVSIRLHPEVEGKFKLWVIKE